MIICGQILWSICLCCRKGFNCMARRGDNIHKRKDGRWEGRYKNGSRPNGVTKYSSVYAYSYSECKKKLAEAQSSSFRSIEKKCTEKVFSDILYQWFSSNRVRLKGATETKYINVIETHIIPNLGGIKLSKLNSSVINTFLENQLNYGGIRNGKPLAPSYVRTMAIIIEAAINYGVMEGLCCPLRTPINKPIIPKNEIVILSKVAEADLTEVLICDSTKVAIGILLGLQAGLRIGEVCALKWSDIDFENNIIHIRHTLSRVQSNNKKCKTMLIMDTPKTPSSLRDVPMPTSLKNVLFVAYQNKFSEFVISNSNTFVGTRTFDYQYRKLLKKYNIQPFSFHTLRHTYATRCAEYGIDAKMLSCLLGHSSSTTSLNIYVHPSLDIAIQHVEQIYCAS